MPIDTDPKKRSIKRHSERCAYGIWCKQTYTDKPTYVHYYSLPNNTGQELFYVKIAKYGVKPVILEATKEQLIKILKYEGILV